LTFAAVFLVPAALVSGCELLGPVPVPIDLDSPPVDLDVGAAVDSAVSESCIAALCKAENGGNDCPAPVDLPAQFLKAIDLNNDGDTDDDGEDAEAALGEAVTDAAKIQVALPVDLGGLLSDAGVGSPDQVKDISFDAVNLAWIENTLTLDAPVLDVYVGPAVEEAELLDVEALIGNAEFAKVGTIGKDTDPDTEGLEVGQVAGVADEVPLSFIEGGNDAFNERLKTFTFTLVVAAPAGQGVKLKEVAGDATKVSKPDGAAQLSLKSKLIYTVNLGEAAGLTE
jgi:hypothetical protein